MITKAADNSVMPMRSIILFVPGLNLHDRKQLREVAGSQFSFPSLELMFARGDYHGDDNQSPEHTLFSLFNVTCDEKADLPIGALSRFLFEGESKSNKWCMRADPVFLQPNRDHLLLMDNAGLDISFQEAEQIVADINQTYADTPWRLNALTPKQWILEQDEPLSVSTCPLSAVAGYNIDKYLPKGGDGRQWHALMNELQMFLHTHPVIQQRQMQGVPVANSVWFWGSGTLPTLTAGNKLKKYAQCWSDETVSLALAKLTNTPRVDLPQNGEGWLQQAITPGNHIMVLGQLHNSATKSDPLLWWQSLAEFDEQWLAPLISAVKNNSVQQVKLVDSDGSRYSLTRRLANRWWKFVSKI